MTASLEITEKKRVEIVFPFFNRKDLTLQCLRSLERLDTTGLDVHIVAVDDGSSDGTSEAIARDHPNVEIVFGDGNLWFTEGTNVGVKAALRHDPDYVLMINDDAVFDQDFLRFMVDTAESNDRSIVGSLLLLWDRPHMLFQVSPRWETWSGGWRHWQSQTVWTIPERPWQVDIIVGNCVLIPAAAIREVGLMNSKRYPNFGDAEYTPRLRKAGWKLLIDPRARVFCQPNDIPVRVRTLSLREKLHALFVNLHHAHNLRRRYFACTDGAPTYFHGVAAFSAFLVRLALRRNLESDYANALDEPPLSKTFADAVID